MRSDFHTTDFSFLRFHPSLHVLLLTSSQITDQQLASLGQVTELHQLYVDGNPQITDAGGAHLHPLNRLTLLHLGGASVTDACVESLPALTMLETRHLNDTGLTDNGLAVLGKMRQLQVLDITRCPRITAAGVEQFQ